MRSDYLPFYAKSCGMRENRGQGRGNPYNAGAIFNSERALNIRRKMVFLYVGDNGG